MKTSRILFLSFSLLMSSSYVVSAEGGIATGTIGGDTVVEATAKKSFLSSCGENAKWLACLPFVKTAAGLDFIADKAYVVTLLDKLAGALNKEKFFGRNLNAHKINVARTFVFATIAGISIYAYNKYQEFKAENEKEAYDFRNFDDFDESDFSNENSSEIESS